MEREKLPGTIRIWPGIAEELVGTKAYFVRGGFFKDVDVALFTHVSNDLGVSWGDRDGHGPRLGRVHAFTGRPRTRRARRGAAAARSTRSS